MLLHWILLGIGVLVVVLGFLWRRSADSKIRAADSPEKKEKRARSMATIVTCIGGYLVLTQLISIIFGARKNEGFGFSLWPERIDVHGFSLSMTVVYMWILMAALIAIALILRIFFIKRFKELPKGVQNVLETIVEAVQGYTDSTAHGTGELLCSYVLTIGALLVGSAFLELFRLRAPASDITFTFALALITFVMISVYGFKRKGVAGRIKALASPSPVVFIFRVISEIAIPISLSCRLFGNMLGGMVVMDLIYSALGYGAVAIPSVLGLFFNVFHPLVQMFIFITLTLTFINDAIE